MPLVSFSSGQVIKSADVNANFGLCVLTDTSRTISVTHTYSATQTFSGGFTTGAGVAVVGNSTVTGTLGGITTLSCTTVTATNLGGTLSTASQPNVTGLGTLNVDLLFGDGTRAGILKTAPASGDLISGVWLGGNNTVSGMTLVPTFNGTAGTKINMCYFNGSWLSAVEVANVASGSGTLQLMKAGGTVSIGGNITYTTAASKLIPGATSLTFRNNADTFDNVAIVDAGDVTVGRGNLTLSLGNFIITGIAGTVQIGGNQVIGPRLTGYTNAWTGAAANKATGYDASTITLPQLAARVRALQESLTSHGLIAA